MPLWNPTQPPPENLYVVLAGGLGDSIQHLRYLSCLHDTLKRQGTNVVVVGYPELKPFLPYGQCIPQEEMPRDGTWIPVHHLPRWFAKHPMAQPDWMLNPLSTRSPVEHRSLSDAQIVGICWAGNPAHPMDVYRSATRSAVEAWLAQFVVPEVVSLQVHGLARVAELVLQVEAVVTVDTMVGHLAGSLGVPVHLLLPPRPMADVRWVVGGWCPYPTHTLHFAQQPWVW